MPKAAGNAVVRNRIKRKLREIWRAKLDAGDRAARRTTTCSSCAPGLPEAAEARGHEWLTERVDEVLEKVARVNRVAVTRRRAPSQLGIALVYAYRWTLGAVRPGGHLQVPPELLAVRDRRAAASTAS